MKSESTDRDTGLPCAPLCPPCGWRRLTNLAHYEPVGERTRPRWCVCLPAFRISSPTFLDPTRGGAPALIPRYTRPDMARIWSDENRFRTWLARAVAATSH